MVDIVAQNGAGELNPYQDINKQYECYLKDGYTDDFFKNLNSHTPHMGVWITCFVAFLQKDKDVKNFLKMWYLQTLKTYNSRPSRISLCLSKDKYDTFYITQ